MSDSDPSIEIRHHDAGVLGYGFALELQEKLHQEVVKSDRTAVVITVEHPPVITLGKNANHQFILGGLEWFATKGIEVFTTDRGGEVTAHEPGQLVVYPILRLGDFQLTPKKYISLLEDTLIQLLSEYGISGKKDPHHPGVWVGLNKICAIGVRIRDRVSMHGIALNICNPLTSFQMIVPCGIANRGVTSMQRERPESHLHLPEVRMRLLSLFSKKLRECIKREENIAGV